MSKQVIGVGTTANDGTGDPLRTAFQKSNANFSELYGMGYAHPPTAALFSTTYSAASATQSTTDGTQGLSFSKTDGGAGSTERCVFRGKAVPGATPWTATMRIKCGPAQAAEYWRFGLAISDGTKVTILGINNQIGGTRIMNYYFSALGTFGSAGFEHTCVPRGLPEWFRITDNGTSILSYFSLDDGVTWTLGSTQTRAATLTPTRVGIAINTFGPVTIASFAPTVLVPYYDDVDFPA